VELERRIVLWVAGAPVTTTVVSTTGLVVVLSVLAVLGGRTIRPRPGRWQAVAEWGVGALEGLLDEVVGDGRTYFPLVATLGLFILAANLMSALPFVEAPTADVNTPAALAIIVFGSVHYYGMRQSGVLGYLRKFAQPVPLLLPINVLSNLTRTFSLAIRLFGNMVSHQIIVAILLLILPLVVPAVLEIFGMFISVLQAYIFTILTMVYLGGAVRAGGEL
jgi:F-type H+-transporting ATPase subunit a